MKFIKGMKETLLWEYLLYNIFDSFDNLVDYSKLNIIERFLLLKSGVLTEDVEIIVKINGKKVKDCWRKE